MTDSEYPLDEPPRTANIADTIFEDLRTQILKGKLKPGERLMAERELAGAYGTNRNTLREAVRKLEQAHLVTVRHGRGVTVSDFRKTGTLELVSPWLQSGPDMRELVAMLEDILVPRIMLMDYATRLAARRAEPNDVRRLKELTDLLITAFETKDAKLVGRGFHRWLDALVDAGHSTAVRWTANPFIEALRTLLDRLPMLWILEPSFPDYLRRVVDGVEAGDETAACRATTDYYERVDAQLLGLLRTGLAVSGRAREHARAGAPASMSHLSPTTAEAQHDDRVHLDDVPPTGES